MLDTATSLTAVAGATIRSCTDALLLAVTSKRAVEVVPACTVRVPRFVHVVPCRCCSLITWPFSAGAILPLSVATRPVRSVVAVVSAVSVGTFLPVPGGAEAVSTLTLTLAEAVSAPSLAVRRRT
jgi:hypothetical protein